MYYIIYNILYICANKCVPALINDLKSLLFNNNIPNIKPSIHGVNDIITINNSYNKL